MVNQHNDKTKKTYPFSLYARHHFPTLVLPRSGSKGQDMSFSAKLRSPSDFFIQLLYIEYIKILVFVKGTFKKLYIIHIVGQAQGFPKMYRDGLQRRMILVL